MTSVDKAAMVWSIAIVAIAIVFTATGQSFTTEVSQSQLEPTGVGFGVTLDKCIDLDFIDEGYLFNNPGTC